MPMITRSFSLPDDLVAEVEQIADELSATHDYTSASSIVRRALTAWLADYRRMRSDIRPMDGETTEDAPAPADEPVPA
jgi:Arc/MetJ-type ribon-helix-helix transcriptional regulator